MELAESKSNTVRLNVRKEPTFKIAIAPTGSMPLDDKLLLAPIVPPASSNSPLEYDPPLPIVP